MSVNPTFVTLVDIKMLFHNESGRSMATTSGDRGPLSSCQLRRNFWRSGRFIQSIKERDRAMTTPPGLQQKFWKSLKSDMTMMLGLVGVEESHTRPMTAQLEGDHGPIFFFTSTESSLVQNLGTESRAVATFAAKGHDLFASVHGFVAVDNDRGTIDRLWNSFVSAWYEDGKDDPKLVLLRFDAERAEIWLNGSSILAGIKMLIGVDPKEDYKDHVADVSLT